MKISSLLAALMQLSFYIYVVCISYLDDCPPTLNFKQNIIM